MATRSSRLTIVFVAVVVVALAAFFGIRTLWRPAQDHFTSSHCTIGEYELDTDQAVGRLDDGRRGDQVQPALPERAAVLALAAGLQESKLRNLAPGARRPRLGRRAAAAAVAGLGRRRSRRGSTTSPKRRPSSSSALVKIKHWQKLPLAEAMQEVQISADGSAYAQHEPEAQALADALQGHKPAAISCTFDKPTLVAGRH